MKRRDGKEEERDYSGDTCPRHFICGPLSRAELGLLSKARRGLSLFHSDSVRAEF